MPAEVLLAAASLRLLFFGLGVRWAHLSENRAAPLVLAGALLLTGAIGAHTARQLIKRRLRPRGAAPTSSVASFSNRSGSSDSTRFHTASQRQLGLFRSRRPCHIWQYSDQDRVMFPHFRSAGLRAAAKVRSVEEAQQHADSARGALGYAMELPAGLFGLPIVTDHHWSSAPTMSFPAAAERCAVTQDQSIYAGTPAKLSTAAHTGRASSTFAVSVYNNR